MSVSPISSTSTELSLGTISLLGEGAKRVASSVATDPVCIEAMPAADYRLIGCLYVYAASRLGSIDY